MEDKTRASISSIWWEFGGGNIHLGPGGKTELRYFKRENFMWGLVTKVVGELRRRSEVMKQHRAYQWQGTAIAPTARA